jgi:predicted Zn finger-like uncharacterized protein
MLIVCPSCASRYSIDDDKIGASGRTVRCASCRTGFFVSLAEAQEPERPTTSQTATPAIPTVPPAATPAPVPEASTDDDIAAKWLAEMEQDGTPVAEITAETIAARDTYPEQTPPQDLDEGSLDSAFEAEMHAAQQEAENAATGMDADARPDLAAAPVTGWRKFLPAAVMARKRANAADQPVRTTKILQKTARSSARPASRYRPLSNSGKPSSLERFKGPLGLGLTGAFLLVGVVLARETIVRAVPASATLFSAVNLPVNLKGLEFADLRSTTLTEGEARFLVVEGGIRSVHATQVDVPLIEIRLSDADGRTLYTWTTEAPRKSLKAGEALHFRTRLATPPEAGRNVEVRFTDKTQSARS